MAKQSACLFRFHVIADTHVTADDKHIYNRHFRSALQDIAEQTPSGACIAHVGDVTDHGHEHEYEQFVKIIGELTSKLPPIYTVQGNHDVGGGEWQRRITAFLGATGNTRAYHHHVICDHDFLFIGTESNDELFCELSEEQLGWLANKLEEAAASQQAKPIFLFLHQPLMDTVAGSLSHQKWYGVRQDKELKEILCRYPQVILFTGHTHWELGSPYTYVPATASSPSMLNCASVAYLWTDEDERKEGSQGYVVDVYEDRTIVRGRDYVSGEWMENAEYTIEHKW